MTAGCRWPVFSTPIPLVKSRYSLPFTSHTRVPSARATKIACVLASPSGTNCRRASTDAYGVVSIFMGLRVNHMPVTWAEGDGREVHPVDLRGPEGRAADEPGRDGEDLRRPPCVWRGDDESRRDARRRAEAGDDGDDDPVRPGGQTDDTRRSVR